MIDIAVVIPAFNEEQTIGDVVASFHKELPEAHIFVVDNNSTDQTQEVAKQQYEKLNCKGKIIFEPTPGKARAIQTAFSEIDAKTYIMVDADMTYPADSVHQLLEPVVNNEADMVVGDRHSLGDYKKKNDRPGHNFGNGLVKVLLSIFFKSKLRDVLSGYRVFNRKFVKNYPILCSGFNLETEISLHALRNGFRVVEVPTPYFQRPEGSFSKLNTFRDGINILIMITNILKNFRPLVFFGIISGLFFLGGLASGFPVIHEFILTQYVKHVPLAILATGLMICSFSFLSIGIILDIIQYNQKFNYQLHLLRYQEEE